MAHSTFTRRRRTGTLFLLGVLGILLPVLTIQANAQTKSAKPEAIAPSPYATRYRVIVRVVRPQWRTAPTPEQVRSSMDYNAVTDRHAPVRGNGSDVQFLSDLHLANPQLRFSGIQAKAAFLLDTDTTWTAPEDFCMQQFHFAIVDRKTELLKPEIPSESPYKIKMEDWQRVRKQGRITLSVRMQNVCLDKNQEQQPHIDQDGVYMVLPYAATCLNSSLPIQAAWSSDTGKGLVLPIYDVVYVTLIPEPAATKGRAQRSGYAQNGPAASH